MGQPGNSLISKVDFSTLWTYSIKNLNETFIINIIKILLKVFIKTTFKYYLRLTSNIFNKLEFTNKKFRYYRRSSVSNKILNLKTVYWDRRVIVGTTDSKIWLHDFKDYFIVTWVVYKNVFTLKMPTGLSKNLSFLKKDVIFKPQSSINFFKIQFLLTRSKFLIKKKKNYYF